MKKIKEWKLQLIQNYDKYITEGLTYSQMAKNVGANSEEAIRSFLRRHDTLRIKSKLISEFVEDLPTKSPAKILIYDLETSPNLSWTWRTFKENIAYNQIEQEWFILTWAAKWLWQDEIYSDKVTPAEIANEDDSRIVKSLWKLIDEADIIVAHNGLRFDTRRMNTRFLLNGLPLPRPYQVVDTLVHARKHLAFVSNRLDALGQILGVGKKVETGGFDLWKRCMKGDSQAIADMEIYNIGDITLLETVYLELLKYIKPHPNLGLLAENTDKPVCPSCGSTHLVENGEYHTTVSVYQAYKCEDCGSQSRARKQLVTKKDHVLSSLPK